MKNTINILNAFLLITKATKNPPEHHDSALTSFKNNFNEEDLKIIGRILSKVSDNQHSSLISAFHDFSMNKNSNFEEIDLSRLNIKRISPKIASKLRGLKKLDLTSNPNLKLDEEWFQDNFLNRLEELDVSLCNLNKANLEVIAQMTSLNKLTMSFNSNLDIKTLQPILDQLEHLDVSNCCLSITDLEYILENTSDLVSLNFSGHDLSEASKLFSKLSEISDLKILKLSGCNLKLEGLLSILKLKNLEELDLSRNHLDVLDQKLLENYSLNLNQIVAENSKLKKLELTDCNLTSYFLKEIFDISGLETLDLSRNKLNFDMNEILKGKASHSLKYLNLNDTNISNFSVFEDITKFVCLETLDFSNNTFDSLPNTFRFGSSKYTLKNLILEECYLNSVIVKEIVVVACLWRS